MFRYTYAAAILSALWAVPAHAQAERCSDALISSNVAWQYDTSLRIATMNLIDRSNFESKRKSLSAGADFIVSGIPISAFGSFDEFSEARSREVQQSRFNYDFNESSYYVAQFVPREAFTAYVECLRIRKQQAVGLHLIPIEISPDYFAADIFWNSPPPGTPATLKVELAGGQFTEKPPEAMSAQSYHPLNVQRTEGQPLRVTVAANGFQPERISIPRYVAPEKVQPWEIKGYRPRIEVLAHVQSMGDVKGVGGEWVGSRGRRLRQEGLQLNITDNVPGLRLEYMCHIEGSGDTLYMGEEQYCGTRGESRRIEGWAVRLVGPAAPFFTLQYWCHLEGVGDSGPMTNEQYCGTRGEKRRMEAIKLVVERK